MPRYLLPTLFLLAFSSAHGAHLPGGNIGYRCISGNQHEVTLRLWRECSGSPMVAQSVAFTNTCGVSFTLNVPLISQEEVSPVCPGQEGQTTCNGGGLVGLELYTYRTTLFLSSCNYWTIYWNICCRNTSLNLSQQQGLYIETRLNNAGAACTVSPVFSDDAPPFVCVGQPVSYDPGVTGPPNYTLRFRMIDARRFTGQVEPVIYQFPHLGEQPYTGMVIDSLTGRIEFTPDLQGYIYVVIEVNMYSAIGTWMGSVMRDFPFVVQACTNQVPAASSGQVGTVTGGATVTGQREVTICPNSSFCMQISIVDNDSGQILELSSNVALALPGSSFTVTGSNPAVASICWSSVGAAPGLRSFVIAASDNACPIRGSQTYTYKIIIASPPVAGTSGTVNYCAIAAPFALIDSLANAAPNGTWSGPNGPNNGQFDPAMNPPGAYTYAVTNALGCNGTATLTVAQLPSNDPYCVLLSAGELGRSSFSIFPNPNPGPLRFGSALLPGSTVSMVDLQGRVAWNSGRLVNSTSTLELPNTMVTGSYIVQVTDAAGLIRSARIELMR